MNRAYRLVWSARINGWIAASEVSRGRGKASCTVKCVTLLSGLCLAFNAAALAPGALPTGGQVSAGQASIQATGAAMTVNQTTAKAAIDWQSFSIGNQATVSFNQPTASAIALNRVLGQDASQIMGRLTSNGQVFLLNPNGVLFGSTAQVNVGGLVASTLGMSNDDFMAGNHRFSGGSTASVTNQGSITAADGGYVALLATQAKNEGVIQARLGNVSLAAGSDVTLNLNNGSLLGLTVNQGAVGALAQNSHLIQAEGGRVLMTAQAADRLVSAVVNNSGVIEARGVRAEDGVIRLLGDSSAGIFTNTGTLKAGTVEGQARSVLQAGAIEANSVNLGASYALVQTQDARIRAEGGDIRLDGGQHTYLSGTVDASGGASKAAGGNITVAGQSITLSATTLDASATSAGGTAGSIRVGGGAYGLDTDISNAATVTVSGATSLRAEGQQGSIVVWSDDTTNYFGKARAGDQGFIEVSSKGTLNLGGTTEVGAGGQILYDPTNIVIDAVAPASFYINLADPTTTAGDNHGTGATVLANGNVVVSSRGDDAGGVNAGAIYLYNGSTGGLISALYGSTAGDQIGLGGVTALTGNNNFVVSSNSWANGAATNAGAVTWGSGTAGVSGVVSAANSLVGGTANDAVGNGGITLLNNGNYVVRSSNWTNGAATNAGAVTWGSGAVGVSGAVSNANSLVGSNANDSVGRAGVQSNNSGFLSYYAGVTPLSNGNYLVSSSQWNGGRGAVTWGNGASGVAGAVDASNSLVGSSANDQVGTGALASSSYSSFSSYSNYFNGIVILPNGNYVVSSPRWFNPTTNASSAGAVTWGSAATGVRGAVSAANSLVGTASDDGVGSGGTSGGSSYSGGGSNSNFEGISVLTNSSNFLVRSADWNNGAALRAGAVTWVDGASGLTGAVSAGNSLVGSNINDRVGYGDRASGSSSGGGFFGGSSSSSSSYRDGVIRLSNGNYLVSSSNWDNGTATDAGAVTWGSGVTGARGIVSVANSLVGTTTNDRVGASGWVGSSNGSSRAAITELSNGNYVVSSGDWSGGRGAATWGNGASGAVGAVTAANSLTGSAAGQRVGLGGSAALSNGNYVVSSYLWNDVANGLTAAGAATWVSGTTGFSGVVSAANSLVGSTANDQVGGSVTALNNGNYVVSSASWDNGATINVGAVTWGSGTAGVSGAVSASNSLIGSTASDAVGSGGIRALNSGNYLVQSASWDNGAATNAGAVTWGSGTTGVIGVVSATNSLVGSTANDQVGNGGITSLSNGNYLVRSNNWTNGAAANAGAVTWGSGTTGVKGVVSDANSLVGSTANDQVGNNGFTLLNNGNYVVNSTSWDNGAAIDAGAVTWASGSLGVKGVVSTANSLVGGKTNDYIGNYGVVALNSGNYVVRSANWDSTTAADAGAVTWGSGTVGVSGEVTAANSLVGTTANDQVGANVTFLNNGNYVAMSTNWDNGAATNAGAVTWGSGAAGVSGVVSAANSLVGSTASDQVGNGGITTLSNGNYVVRSNNWTNGAATNAGAVTWGNGTAGVKGVVSDANSLVGSTANDQVGSGGIAVLANGSFVALSPNYNNQAGAAWLVVDPSSAVAAVNGSSGTANVSPALLANAAGVGATVTLQATNNITVNSAVSVAGKLNLLAGNVMTLNTGGTITSTATGDAIVLSSNTFVNNAGSNALTTNNGRWLVYSNAPAGNTFGGLASGNNAVWNATHAANAPATIASGNRYVFAQQPTVNVTANVQTKVYDGSASAAPTYTTTGLVNAASFGNVFTQDAMTGALATSASANVGSYAITQGTLAGPAGYLTGTYAGANSSITPKAVTITGMAATSKVYNANDVAALTGGTVAGTVVGETLNFTGQTGQFNNKNVGTGKAVTVTGLALTDGTGLASNYSVTQPVGLTADITAKAVTAGYTAANKTFDNTTSASVMGSSADIIGGDAVSFTQSAAFASAAPGVGKTVNITGIALVGVDSGNYALLNTTATAVANITAVPTTAVSAVSAAEGLTSSDRFNAAVNRMNMRVAQGNADEFGQRSSQAGPAFRQAASSRLSAISALTPLFGIDPGMLEPAETE